MSESGSEQSYFSIQYATSINVVPLSDDESLPAEEDFEQEIPIPFQISSEASSMDHAALRSMRKLGEAAEDLTEYLNLQARKINIIMSYVLQMQDDEKYRAKTSVFGAGEFSYHAPESLPEGSHAKVKLFLPEESAAVYSYATVTKCSAHSNGGYVITMQYTRIREQDRELLIRATLHQQTKQLKKRAQQRENEL